MGTHPGARVIALAIVSACMCAIHASSAPAQSIVPNPNIARTFSATSSSPSIRNAIIINAPIGIYSCVMWFQGRMFTGPIAPGALAGEVVGHTIPSKCIPSAGFWRALLLPWSIRLERGSSATSLQLTIVDWQFSVGFCLLRAPLPLTYDTASATATIGTNEFVDPTPGCGRLSFSGSFQFTFQPVPFQYWLLP